MLLLYLAKRNALRAVTQQHQKGTKFYKKSHKSVSVYCWVVYSSSKVDIKVINASFTRNQCTMCNAVLNARWDTTTVRRHWTEQWQHDQVGRRLLPNRTDFINFFSKEISSTTTLDSIHIFIQQLTCNVMFSFRKSFVKCPSLSVNGIFDDFIYDVIST